MGTARQIFLMAIDDALHSARYASKVRAIHVGIDVQHRHHIVVAYRTELRSWSNGGNVAKNILRLRNAGNGGGRRGNAALPGRSIHTLRLRCRVWNRDA